MFAILIPCYNEEFRFPEIEFKKYLNQLIDLDIHFYLVNDGSNDNTLLLLTRIVDELNTNNVFIIDCKENKGKAEALRYAFNKIFEKNYTWFGYLDADFATHPSELVNIYKKIITNPAIKMAMGARWLRLGAEIVRNPYRHYFGRFFATVASMILKLKVYDTQCGAKIIHRDYIDFIKNDPFVSKWIFDVEIIARIIEKRGLSESVKSIVEIPLNKWVEIPGSKIKLKDLLILPLELWKIKSKYRLR